MTGKWRHMLALPVVGLCLLAQAATACQTPDSVAGDDPAAAPYIRHVETRIMPAVVLADTPPRSLRERMAELDVPGVSVAVVIGGRIAWTRGWGVRDVTGCDLVTPDTRFQAASISKPVFALAVMRLAEQGVVDLDADVETYLTRWHLPPAPDVSAEPVTLRQLLSHTAGLTLHGFPGYSPDEPIPTVIDILNGEPVPRAFLSMVPPGTTRADSLRREHAPGRQWQYSGGGYLLAQQALFDRTGEDFEAMMQRLVLGPAGMTHSSFTQPPAAATLANAAHGHGDGAPVAGGFNLYPHQAAGGMWSTPTDIARLFADVRAAATGQSGHLLSPDSARAMTTAGLGDWGIGFAVTGAGAARRFEHGGANMGFRAWALMFTDSGDGVVVMTNADSGGDLADDIIRAVATVYGWPALASEPVVEAALSPADLAARAGHYAGGGFASDVRLVGGRLFARTFGPFPERLVMLSATRFRTLSSGLEGEFALDASGAVTGINVTARGQALSLARGEAPAAAATPATPFFLRGSMNDWSASQLMEPDGQGGFATEVALDAGQYQFKLGSDDWQLVDFGGAGARALRADGAATTLLPRGGNLRLLVEQPGRYRFVMTGAADGTARLVVTRTGDVP